MTTYVLLSGPRVDQGDSGAPVVCQARGMQVYYTGWAICSLTLCSCILLIVSIDSYWYYAQNTTTQCKATYGSPRMYSVHVFLFSRVPWRLQGGPQLVHQAGQKSNDLARCKEILWGNKQITWKMLLLWFVSIDSNIWARGLWIWSWNNWICSYHCYKSRSALLKQ